MLRGDGEYLNDALHPQEAGAGREAGNNRQADSPTTKRMPITIFEFYSI